MKWKDQADLRASMTRQEHLEFMDDLVSLPIAPWSDLESEANQCVVPYDTIECLFNEDQAWGNLGNANPIAIYYNM